MQKIVDFCAYCPDCVHWEKEGYEEPCNQCLNCPTNEDSRKPVEFKENPKPHKPPVRKVQDD